MTGARVAASRTAEAHRISPAGRTTRRSIARTEAVLVPVMRRALATWARLLGPLDWRQAATHGTVPAERALALVQQIATDGEVIRQVLIAQSPPVREGDAGVRRVAALLALAEQRFEDVCAQQIGDLIQGLTTTQLGTVRTILARILVHGATEDAIAVLGQTAGLTERGVRAVERAWQDALLQGVEPASARRVADTVRVRLQRQRARLIARTEAVRHANAVIQARAEDMAGTGVRMMRQWLSARDEAVDGGDPAGPCRLNDNDQLVELQQPFPSGHHLPPAHPGCRCVIEIFAADLL